MEKLIYSFLKEIKDNDDRLIKGEKIIIPNWDDYCITKEVYGKLIKDMEGKKLIDVSYSLAKGLPRIIHSVNITENGNKYLIENSKIGKLYTGIKGIKEFLKLEL